MSDVVIRVENLYKEYKLGVISHGTLTHDLQSWWARVRGKEDPNSLISTNPSAAAETGSFLALKDINFEVKAGDRVGIIGKNGAGKSTLLKILSKVTAPTKGQVKMKGRVGSLLEVGTGFHSELTGRENIYLNGAILGMRKKEIDRKLDEIVDFAGVEKHIDTPVKRYSSGMNVRLGFAVAAHLEPEILIVDEVLAVGDAEFQKKAIGKMEDVSKGEGRTILFVSHNMGAVRQLCDRGIVLRNGEVVLYGKADESIDFYLKNNFQMTLISEIKKKIDSLPQDPVFKFIDIKITQDGSSIEIVDNSKSVEISIKYEVFEKTKGLRVYFDVCDTDGTILFRSFNDELNGNCFVNPGKYTSVASIPPNILSPVNYYLLIRGTIHNIRTFEPKEGIIFELKVERFGIVNKSYPDQVFVGKLAPFIEWNTEEENI